jgi:hypothetical protein
MDAVEKFHQHNKTVDGRRTELEAEKVKLERHLQYFEDAKERYLTLDAPEDAKNTETVINAIRKKLADNEQALEALNVIPFAEAAMSELVEQRSDIEDRLHIQHEAAIAARDEYLRQLHILGEIRDKSRLLSWASRPVALKLRLNPLDELFIGNRYDLSITQDEVDTYLSY